MVLSYLASLSIKIEGVRFFAPALIRKKIFIFFPALKTREKRRPMLNIKTIKNSLISDESKDGFCFRSSCSQNLSQKKLAAEMADWNSSFTEADYPGMLSVMEKSL